MTITTAKLYSNARGKQHFNMQHPPIRNDAATEGNQPEGPTSTASPRTEEMKKSRPRDWFSIPRPLKQLFDTFPLVTYPSNGSPLRVTSRRLNDHGDDDADLPSLYVFCSSQDALLGRPSFNPGCLKWQVRSNGIFCYFLSCVEPISYANG